MLSKALIIPAAGSGSRMNREVPKPFIKIGGRSILEHTLLRFINLEGLQQIVLATSDAHIDRVTSLLNKLTGQRGLNAACVAGGEERQESVFNALGEVGDVDLVMVHDAVRPFVEPGDVMECCRVAGECGGAVLGVKTRDTIKYVNEDRFITATPDRRFLWQAQTPQVFKTGLLRKAHLKARDQGFVGTDDASLVERLGAEVRMVEGDAGNFKITYPRDLKFAKILIAEQSRK